MDDTEMSTSWWCRIAAFIPCLGIEADRQEIKKKKKKKNETAGTPTSVSVSVRRKESRVFASTFEHNRFVNALADEARLEQQRRKGSTVRGESLERVHKGLGSLCLDTFEELYADKLSWIVYKLNLSGGEVRQHSDQITRFSLSVCLSLVCMYVFTALHAMHVFDLTMSTPSATVLHSVCLLRRVCVSTSLLNDL